jgi:hypothetical protein
LIPHHGSWFSLFHDDYLMINFHRVKSFIQSIYLIN